MNPGDRLPDIETTLPGHRPGMPRERVRIVDRELVSTPACETEAARSERIKKGLPTPMSVHMAGRVER